MPAKNEEYARNVPLLNKVFAWSSLALLAGTVWMVWDDYYRPWKRTQRDFRALTAKKTEEAIKQAEQGVDQETLKKTQEDLSAARAEADKQKKSLQELDEKLARAKVTYYKADVAYKNTKSIYDAVRFEYEELESHKAPRAAEKRKELDEVQKRLADYKVAYETATTERDALQKQQDDILGAQKAVEKKQQDLMAGVERLQKKLATVEPEGVIGKGFEAFRNAPLLDFMAPSLKIQQVVLDNQSKDINFLTIPRVDRCQTCHLAADQAGYENDPQPFRSHPHPEVFLTGKSPHPVEKIGCTVCHRGLDRATDFLDAAHWPGSDEQKAEWVKKYHWHPKEHETNPMLPSRFVEASCRSCHQGVVHIPTAAHWNEGRDLVERAGCFGCHKIRGFEGLRKVGPPLTRLTWKTDPQWVGSWVENPAAFRPATWMPRFFHLDNNSATEDVQRTNQEIRGIVSYLFDKTEPGGFPKLPGTGDAKKGETIVTSFGCLGCHAVARLEKAAVPLRRRFGPNLDGIGAKAKPEWIYAWVRDPKSYFPETRMPDLRLTDQEALDVTAYLMTLKEPEGWQRKTFEADAPLLDKMVEEQLRARMTAREVQAKIASMSEKDKEVYLGQRMITRYGCFGCHLIQGFETTPPIGTELSEEGSKEVDRFDFGYIHIPETRHDWITQKLENPRIFDRGKVKTPDEKLKMPLFNLTPEERQAVVTLVLSLVKEKPPLATVPVLDARRRALEAGRRMVQDHNCQGCHLLEGEGQDIRMTIARKMVEEQGIGQEDADSRAIAFSPPFITGEGARVRSDWLFHFLKGPTPIRPWLSVRMPTFGFTDEEANTLLRYFTALAEAPFPFETPPGHPPATDLAAARTLTSKDYFDCFSCHQQGEKKPAGDPSGWAPDLAMARQRLRPEWIVDWIKDPQKLYPGTKMPTFYDPASFASAGPDDVLGGDEERQIRALRDYLLTLGGERAGS
ncbi:MAG TPA: c-type cytochrome [Candidatus Polarisedimenticolia bacterium]|nr:c-type cytochrome [Candidatus Polarisedimenticolia bacterium]